MQNDSIQPSTSGHLQVKQKVVSQDTQIKPYECSQCTLIFRSRLYLFEHLNKVHRFDVDMALKNAGLRQTGTKCTNIADLPSRPNLKCQQCDFTSCNEDALKEHAKFCPKLNEGDKAIVSRPLHVSGSPSTQSPLSPTNQSNEDSEAHTLLSVLPDFETDSTSSSSKNQKIYRRPTQTLNAHIMGTSGVKGKLSVEIDDGAIETLVLKDSLPTASPNSRGVFQVTAKTTQIDVSNNSPACFLQHDPLEREKLRKPIEKVESEEEVAKKVIKRMKGEITESIPTKRAKSNAKDPEHSGKKHLKNQQCPSRANISFEVSEDEAQEKMIDVEKSIYFCKHCDYSDYGFSPMVAHYKEDHPYVRYSTAYIVDSSDQSATFRCLLCPVEFATVAGLRKHYMERHPDGPDIFSVKSSEVRMAFKCFLCQFVAPNKISLKDHYKETHPKLSVGDSLSYCQYLVSENKKLSLQLNQCSTPSKQEKHIESFPENRPLPSVEGNTLPQQPTLKGGETTMYKCNKCAFIHKSVIVMHVHYQKSHPEEAITIDKIKLSARIGQQETSPKSQTSSNPVGASVLTKPDRALSEKTKNRKAKTQPENAQKSALGSSSWTTEPGEASKEKEAHFESDGQAWDDDIEPNPYTHVESLFYCIKCNFASQSAKGVLRHQSIVHIGSAFGRKQVVQYSALVVEKIQKSKTPPKGLPFYTGLPLPLILKGDEHSFFCHFCNYRNQKFSYVTGHYRKVHGSKLNVENIKKYTAFVHEQTQKSNVKITVQEEVSPGLVPNVPKALSTQGTFQCSKCSYNSKHVYLLRRHLLKVHHFKMTASEILNEAFKQGLLQTGYHCEFCAFSHHDVELFNNHYQQEHPEYKRSFKHVSTQLYVGTKAPHQKMKSKLKYNVGCRGDPQEKQSCGVKDFGSGVRNQAHAGKPLSSKEDCQKESDKVSEAFESYQEPLDFDNLSDEAEDESSTLFKCPYCSVVLNSEHDLSLHCKRKHYADEHLKQEPVKKQVHLFQCLSCPYVHTKYHGVLAHCQRKHTHLKPRADSLHMDILNPQKYSKEDKDGDSLQITGYMCKICTLVCKKLEELKEHCEIAHGVKTTGGVSNKPSGSSKSTYSKVPSSHKLNVSKTSLLYKYKFTKIKCPYCPYVCCSQPRLNKHLIAQHKYGKCSNNEIMVDSSGSSRTSNEDKLVIYRCPSCLYVNTSHHGILTHCQMRHPMVHARAYKLKTTEIFHSNIMKPALGKGSNQNGYLCKFCQRIYASTSHLKTHCLKSHGRGKGSETLKEPEFQTVTNHIRLPKSETDKGHIEPTGSPNTVQSVPLQSTPKMYNCHMCSYKGLYRRYLQVHYRKTHRLDEATTFKLLQKYNKLKIKKVSTFPDPPESEVKESRKCVMCPHLTFKSSQKLVSHYATFHPLDGKMDFIILSTGEKKKTTGLYRCSHCVKQLNGIRKLCVHLNYHRKQMKESLALKSEPQPNELYEVPSVEVGENTSRSTSAAQIFHMSPSPAKSSSEVEDQGRLKHACEQCGRTFMSMKGLLSHERSHAAVAGLKKLYDTPGMSGSNSRADKYMSYKGDCSKPFLCQICSYRTTTLSLWRRHFYRIHPELVGTDHADESSQGPDLDRPKSSEQSSIQVERDEIIKPIQSSLYMEPPAVQRQLSHYNMIAQSTAVPHLDNQQSKLPESSLLRCELCNFTSEHLSSIRRHYLNRHGKKILRCKDCSFFTGSQQTMKVHIETGHSTSRSARPILKDFCCPFCLYQTQNKNFMIDHIVLHREERVVPVEMSRPKLSRYLTGIVFRCHKCTFSCGDADNLCLHMSKHEDVQPYKCRLCFFDCANPSDLAAHLSDKHQVLRNHEIVGERVNIVNLESRVNITQELSEERWLNTKETFDHHENVQNQESFSDSENNPQSKRSEENSTNESVTVQNDTTKEEDKEEGNPEQMLLIKTHTKERLKQGTRNLDLDVKMASRVSEKESSLQPECEALTKETVFKDGVTLLDEDGHFSDVLKTQCKGPEMEAAVKVQAADEDRVQPPDDLNIDSLASDLKKSPTAPLSQQGSNKAVKSITVQKKLQILPKVGTQLKLDRVKDLSVSYSKVKHESTEDFREMPVLENEYLKEKMLHLKCEDENHLDNDNLKQGGQKKPSLNKENHRLESEEKESAGGAPASSSADEESYKCDFCGRNLDSGADLKRHIMRHGM